VSETLARATPRPPWDETIGEQTIRFATIGFPETYEFARQYGSEFDGFLKSFQTQGFAASLVGFTIICFLSAQRAAALEPHRNGTARFATVRDFAELLRPLGMEPNRRLGEIAVTILVESGWMQRKEAGAPTEPEVPPPSGSTSAGVA